MREKQKEFKDIISKGYFMRREWSTDLESLSLIISHQTLIVSRRTNVKSRRKLLIKLLPSYSSNIHITMTVLNISIISVRVVPSLHLAFTLNFDVIWYNFYPSLRQPSELGRKHTSDMRTHFNKTKMRLKTGWSRWNGTSNIGITICVMAPPPWHSGAGMFN